MGIWKKIFGGAEGIREAMREAYENHRRAAIARTIPVPPGECPHHFGLYGALASRHIVRNIPCSEIVILSQLAPFYLMDETDAVEALAECVVFWERPRDARLSWLTAKINKALLTAPDNTYLLMAAHGIMNGASWAQLLEPNTMQKIRKAVEDVESERG